MKAKILFKLSGSIAAWKACAVISRLVQDGHEVQTVATSAALRFVGAATLEGLTGRAVKSDLWELGTAMEHINLVKWAHVVVLCPGSANTINALAAGLADDLVGALFLAHDWKKPYLLAPAMNPAMWSHPATSASIERLRAWGVRVLPVGRGRLACGDEGEGRLPEPETILEAIRSVLGSVAPSSNGRRHLRVLVTSGGTEEPVDGVRTLGNLSTGRTGALIADALVSRGHDVLLLRSQRAARPAENVREETFSSFGELESALKRSLRTEKFDAVIHAAAVSDYSVDRLLIDGIEHAPGVGKIDSGREVSIRLRPNPKLVDHLREWSSNPELRVVAFKLTRDADGSAAHAAVETLFKRSSADAVVHNDLSTLDERSPESFPATLWGREGGALRLATRTELASALEEYLVDATANGRNGNSSR